MLNDAYGLYLDHVSPRYVNCADLPLKYDNILFVRPMSKDRVACSIRLGYTRAGERLNRLLEPWREPYVSRRDVRAGTELLRRQDLVDRSISIQIEARKTLEDELQRLGFRFRTGPGPWVLVHVGPGHAGYVGRLRAKYGIRVQDQEPPEPRRAGWLRISATVPEEMRYCALALSELRRRERG